MKLRTSSNKRSTIFFILIVLIIASVQRTRALERPFIWADAADKIRLEELIDNYDWAAGR